MSEPKVQPHPCEFVMKSKFILSISLVILLASIATGELVHVAEIDGTINAGVAQYIKRVIGDAEDEGADLVVIKLDTPGGMIEATREIVREILDSKVNIAVYVHKEGGWAFSAGTYILMASDIAAVHPMASIGSAQPIPADNKSINAMASYMVTLAETNNRNSSIARAFVAENLDLTGKEALKKGVIEYAPENLEQLLSELNLSHAQIKEVRPSFQEGLFSMISHPQIVSLLFLIGFLGIIYVIKTGELELSLIPAIALLLGLWGLGTIKFSPLGIVLILIGIALLFIEFSQPGISIFGVSGSISIVLGILTIDAEPFFTPSSDITFFVMGISIAIIVFFIIVAKKVAGSIRERIKTGAEALIGEKGMVVEELRPRGLIKLHGELWTAISSDKERIEVGKEVKVVRLEGNLLYVIKSEG